MIELVTTYWKVLLQAFGLAMLPVLELRAAVPFALAKGVPLGLAALVCCVGNVLPVPFILLFLRRAFAFMEHFAPTQKVVRWLERRARKNESKLQRLKLLGLFLLVAVPLPGTGAWTGALVAVVFDLRMRQALPTIAAGVVASLGIVVGLSYLGMGLFAAFAPA